jgi:hypothetical protein
MICSVVKTFINGDSNASFQRRVCDSGVGVDCVGVRREQQTIMNGKYILVRASDGKFSTLTFGWSDEYPNAAQFEKLSTTKTRGRIEATGDFMVYTTEGYEQGTGPVFKEIS